MLMVQHMTLPPSLGCKFSEFNASWTDWILGHTGLYLDIIRHIPLVWCLDIPSGLKELLYKCMSGSLPLGRSWHGKSLLGKVCHCGSAMLLEHIWSSCLSYN